MSSMFFPIAVAAVIMIVFAVMYLVVQEKSSSRRQKVWVAGYFATQNARFARAEQVQREHELTGSGHRAA